MDGFVSAFDGMIEIIAPQNPTKLIAQTPSVSVAQSLVGLLATASEETVSDEVRDLIVSKAKVSLSVTEQLVKKYHANFMTLYNAARDQIKSLEEELAVYQNPAKDIMPVITFEPEAATLKDEMLQYIIEANMRGLSLIEVLPEELKNSMGLL